MLNNEKLNRRLKKIVKDLKEKWGITPYRIAVESNIPHSSLKYMFDGKFEWKLNHLLSFIDFLNRNNAKISLEDLLDFENKKSLSQIMNTEKADFRKVIYGDKEGYKNLLGSGDSSVPLNARIRDIKPKDFQVESEGLTQEISEVVKESPLFKHHKISVGIKVSSKNFDFHKDINFSNGRELKS
jgi:hypothetical protein